MSIVLVIIGLVIGGVLVGQDLISAATVRSQISQIEKYNTAVRTFQGKYGYLPGDMPSTQSTQFGLFGAGDGNGLIDRMDASIYGENGRFWADLSTAGLIEGKYPIYAGYAGGATPLKYFPEAKLGGSNYMSAYSGGVFNGNPSAQDPSTGMYSFNYGRDGNNYFTIVYSKYLTCCGPAIDSTKPIMTVNQANNIDKKIDDGLPQTGNVIAAFWQGTGGTGPAACCVAVSWSGANTSFSATNSQPHTAAENATSKSCYDNSNSTSSTGQNGVTQHYSLGVGSSPNNLNCGLSFKMK